jgi:hypothetical protein
MKFLPLLPNRPKATVPGEWQFNLDDDALDDLKVELIEAQQVAIDEDGNVLVWTGDGTAPPPPDSSAH